MPVRPISSSSTVRTSLCGCRWGGGWWVWFQEVGWDLEVAGCWPRDVFMAWCRAAWSPIANHFTRTPPLHPHPTPLPPPPQAANADLQVALNAASEEKGRLGAVAERTERVAAATAADLAILRADVARLEAGVAEQRDKGDVVLGFGTGAVVNSTWGGGSGEGRREGMPMPSPPLLPCSAQ